MTARVWYVVVGLTSVSVEPINHVGDPHVFAGGQCWVGDTPVGSFGPGQGGMVYPWWALDELERRMPSYGLAAWLVPSSLEGLFEELGWDPDEHVVLAGRVWGGARFLIVTTESGGVPL